MAESDSNEHRINLQGMEKNALAQQRAADTQVSVLRSSATAASILDQALTAHQHSILKEQITDWSEAVIALLKQKMWAEEVHLVRSSGRPWYRRGDSWVSESWWIEAAENIYKKHCENPDRWLIAELEVLCQYFPSQYRSIARQRIDHWYNDRAHDPEDWIELTCQVYPEHPILKEYLDGLRWQLASASLGDPVQTERIRDLFGADYQEQNVFWTTDLICNLVRWGGQTLLEKVVTPDQLAQVHQWNLLEAKQPDNIGVDYIDIAVHLGWKDVIKALAQNSGYLDGLNSFGILWWSLTDQQEITQQLVMRQNPQTFQDPMFQDVYSHRVELAIAWQRSLMK